MPDFRPVTRPTQRGFVRALLPSLTAIAVLSLGEEACGLPFPVGWMKRIVPIYSASVAVRGRDTVPSRGPLIATGFLYGIPEKSRLFVVTCRHVVRDLDSLALSYHIRANAETTVFLQRGGFPFFVYDDTGPADVAVCVAPSVWGGGDFEYFTGATTLASDSLNSTDPVYIVGYPLGMVGLALTPIIRGGIVALPAQGNPTFVLDAHIYPGNSGGPVVTVPDIYNYRTNTIGDVSEPMLVGVASEYVAYRDVAVSLQTKRQRVTFEENSGMAIAVSSRELQRLLERLGAGPGIR